MSMRVKTRKERQGEMRLRQLGEIFEKRGIVVRREKLSRGRSYRVKSGDCLFSGGKFLFVDRRLPVEQQISLLVDYILEYQFELEEEEKQVFSSHTSSLISSYSVAAAAA